MSKAAKCETQLSLTQEVNSLSPFEVIKELRENNLRVKGNIDTLRDRLIRYYMKKIYYDTLVKWSPVNDERGYECQQAVNEINSKTAVNDDASTVANKSSTLRQKHEFHSADSAKTIAACTKNISTQTESNNGEMIFNDQNINGHHSPNQLSKEVESIISAIDKLKMSNLCFSGTNFENSNEFIDKLGAFKMSTDLSEETFMRTLPVVMNGNASTWFQQEGRACKTWNAFVEAFKRSFTGSIFQSVLRNEIRYVIQGPYEPIENFLKKIRYVYDRFDPPVPINVQLDLAYKNLHPTIHKFISRDQFSSYYELESLGARVEAMLYKIQSNHPELSPLLEKFNFSEANDYSKPKNDNEGNIEDKKEISNTLISISPTPEQSSKVQSESPSSDNSTPKLRRPIKNWLKR